MTIAAIQTRYDGHHFRSRLEARWAVFFNEMSIPWEYEPQGYEINGRKYLPDFWLPDQGVWFEVKGLMIDGPTECLYLQFAEEFGAPFVVAVGSIKGATFGLCDPAGSSDEPCEWVQCARCGFLEVAPDGWHMDNMSLCGRQTVTDQIRAAYTVASSARFEHGQQGKG